MTCAIHSYRLDGRCFVCGHVNEAIRADQAEADARHREYAKAYAMTPPTLPPEIEAAIADAGQALVDAWDSAQSGPPHRFAVYTDPEGDPEVAAGWMAMARMHAAAIAAAREAGRREVLEGAAGVEEAIDSIACRGCGHDNPMTFSEEVRLRADATGRPVGEDVDGQIAAVLDRVKAQD